MWSARSVSGQRETNCGNAIAEIGGKKKVCGNAIAKSGKGKKKIVVAKIWGRIKKKKSATFTIFLQQITGD